MKASPRMQNRLYATVNLQRKRVKPSTLYRYNHWSGKGQKCFISNKRCAEKHCLNGAVTPLPHTPSWRALGQLYFYLFLYLWRGCSVLHRAAILSFSLISRHSHCQSHSNVNRRHRAVYKTCEHTNTQNVNISIGEAAGSFLGVLQEKQWNVGSYDKNNFITSERYRMLFSLTTTRNML